MDSTEESSKKTSRAKSFNSTTSPKLKTEATKRKSFNVNEEAKSLDLALVRLKKSKLVNGDSIMASGSPTSPLKCRNPEMFMDVSSNSTFCPPGMDNASLMSMNFSHYELMRNLSNPLCNSEGTFSSTTCDTGLNSSDTNLMNEHLERYFRSAEMWSQYRDGGSSGLHFNGPEK